LKNEIEEELNKENLTVQDIENILNKKEYIEFKKENKYKFDEGY